MLVGVKEMIKKVPKHKFEKAVKDILLNNQKYESQYENKRPTQKELNTKYQIEEQK